MVFNATFNNISVITWQYLKKTTDLIFFYLCWWCGICYFSLYFYLSFCSGHRDCDCMVVGFITTYTVSSYHYLRGWVWIPLRRGVFNAILASFFLKWAERIYQKKLKQLYIIISINCFISPGTQPSNPTWMVWFGFMVFNATLDNISVLSWQSIW
jgi:hypothetical protein